MNLLWAHALLIWSVATYAWRDPLDDEPAGLTRRWRLTVVGRSLAAALLIWWASSSVPLALLHLGFGVALPFARAMTPARRSAELEILANAGFVAMSFLLITTGRVELSGVLFHVTSSDRRIATACVVTALGVFTIHGGTYIVRGLLKKSGAVPMITVAGSERTVDVKEYNRGRLIGALERFLLFAVVMAGSYEALGFIVAAKGLVRSREFEVSRDMTEYFLIGSLTSVVVALSTGWLARHLIAMYW